MKAVLIVNNLSFSYGTTEVLSNISFELNSGDYVALAGPNGAGKTTLIKIILGLEKKLSGNIKIYDKNIEQFSDWKRIGYLPQQTNTFNPLFPATAKEVVGLGLLSLKKYPKRFNRDDENKINSIFELLDIIDLKNQPVGQLSGGEQQRVFLARALVSEPELLILDEPSTALDPKMREHFFALVEKLNKEKAVTVIIITHDTSHIGKYASKLLYLDKQIMFYGLFADFCHSKEMEKYFGHFSQHLICRQH